MQQAHIFDSFYSISNAKIEKTRAEVLKTWTVVMVVAENFTFYNVRMKSNFILYQILKTKNIHYTKNKCKTYDEGWWEIVWDTYETDVWDEIWHFIWLQ